MIRLLFLSGHIRREILTEPNFGFMVTPATGNRLPPTASWAGDTGCFLHPERFNLDRYRRWLARKGRQDKCLFVTAPDRVADAAATWRVAEPVLPILRGDGWPVALVAQDGLTPETTCWEAFDWLFIGGSTEWKMGREAAALMRSAKVRGKKVHIGRVNEPLRLLYAARAGADSVDGNRLCFGFNANWPLIREWVRCANAQMSFCFPGE